MSNTNTNHANPTTNLVDTVAAQGSFKTFSKALHAAGLIDALKAPGPFTVFAPTDAAFDKLPAGKLDSWLKPENKTELISVIKYHYTAGRMMMADAGKLDSAKTAQGQTAKLKLHGGKVSIDGANVSLTDIKSSNGVLHAIDEVLVPTTTKH
jgi:uncharacterized surface protein with fasciclin (FAS1) repeats